MAAITSAGVCILSEPFDFDSIGVETVHQLGLKFFGDASALAICPKPVGKQVVSITLWEETGPMSCETHDSRYTEKGLAPNPWHLVALAIKQPDFAGARTIATQWKDEKGRFCYASFEGWGAGRIAYVSWRSAGWHNRFLFSGSGK